MEWGSVRMNHVSENYQQFGKIVSKFMSIMNGQTREKRHLEGDMKDLKGRKILNN